MDQLTSTDLLDETCDYFGLMRDEEIRAAIANNQLLDRDTTEDRRVRQASYELRVSSNVEFLVLQEGDAGAATARYERPANGIGDTLRIDPGHTVKVFTAEYFKLPTNVVAHVFPVGNIYKLGLSPETTYADPGFEGQFYIVVCNYSARVVELEVGKPIARVEFIRLARSTKRPHPGAGGITEPRIWPRRIERRGIDTLRNLGVDTLLDELDKNDPPHFETAFIAREVKRQVTAHDAQLQTQVANLGRQLAWLSLVAYAAIIIICMWLVTRGWHLLPEPVQSKVTDEAVKAICGAMLAIVPLAFRRVRKTLRLAIRG